MLEAKRVTLKTPNNMNDDEKQIMDLANEYTIKARKGYPRVMDEIDLLIRDAFIAGAKTVLTPN